MFSAVSRINLSFIIIFFSVTIDVKQSAKRDRKSDRVLRERCFHKPILSTQSPYDRVLLHKQGILSKLKFQAING